MEKQTTTQPAPGRFTAGDAVKVLLIDDESTTYDWLSYNIEDAAPIELLYASTLDRAITYLSAPGHIVDFVLLDLSLPFREGEPQMRGPTAMREFQQQCPLVPVVILTSVDEEELRKVLLSEGAYGYVVKYSMPESEMMRLLVSIGLTLRAAGKVTNEKELLRRAAQAYVGLSSTLHKTQDPERLLRATAQMVLLNGEMNMAIFNKLYVAGAGK